jgi:hypothetical protein
MRTTLTIEPDVAQQIRQRMAEIVTPGERHAEIPFALLIDLGVGGARAVPDRGANNPLGQPIQP